MRPFLLACLLLPLSLLAQNPGELDLSFDGDGKLVIADIDSMSDPFAVPTSDLGLIIGFNRTVDGQQQTCLLRLNEDGSVNTNYGVQGLVVSTAPFVLKDVLIRPDDEVVLVGQEPGQEVLRVERYLADGGLDASFGTGGAWELVIPDTIPNSFVSGGLMLPDDRILVNGSFGVLRMLPDGEIDVDFNVNNLLNYTSSFATNMDGTILCIPSGETSFKIFDYDINEQIISGGLSANGVNRVFSKIENSNINGTSIVRARYIGDLLDEKGFSIIGSPQLTSGNYHMLTEFHSIGYTVLSNPGGFYESRYGSACSDQFGNYYLGYTEVRLFYGYNSGVSAYRTKKMAREASWFCSRTGAIRRLNGLSG